MMSIFRSTRYFRPDIRFFFLCQEESFPQQRKIKYRKRMLSPCYTLNSSVLIIYPTARQDPSIRAGYPDINPVSSLEEGVPLVERKKEIHYRERKTVIFYTFIPSYQPSFPFQRRKLTLVRPLKHFCSFRATILYKKRFTIQKKLPLSQIYDNPG